MNLSRRTTTIATEPGTFAAEGNGLRRTFRAAVARGSAVLAVAAIALIPLGGVSSAQAATAAVSVQYPKATCSMGYDLRPFVMVGAYLQTRTPSTAYYAADLLLFYGGSWHTTTLRTPTAAVSTSSLSRMVQGFFYSTPQYRFGGLTAKVRLWVWNNYGSGWAWYFYDTNTCPVLNDIL